MNKRIILWNSGIDDLLQPKSKNSFVGGIMVQSYMWSNIFIKNHWEVHSFTRNKPNKGKVLNDITFNYYPVIKIVNPLISFIVIIYTILKIKPKAILFSGADRDLALVSLLSKIRGVKLMLLFASDSDLKPGKELISRKHDKFLFQYGLKNTNYFIVQNKHQATLLQNNYRKDNFVIIPNMWNNNKSNVTQYKEKKFILWVSNFRELKRPQWFIRMAEKNPQLNFKMVGFPLDNDLYEKCRNQSAEIPNLEFKGGLSFIETDRMFESAHLFVCTSEVEGFPNTFLQAWINNCPIITTFDPGGIIKEKGLGVYCSDQASLDNALVKFDDIDFYSLIQNNIKAYFLQTYDAQKLYNQVYQKFRL